MLPDLNIPKTAQKRVVIIGGGFGGMALAGKLSKRGMFQVVLLDKNNFYQFQPLYYQVATAGLEPTSIIYPFRKNFQHKKNIHIRICEVQNISPTDNKVSTSLGDVQYDYLVMATGASTNFFNMANMQKYAHGMKSIQDATDIRNHLLMNIEEANAYTGDDIAQRNALLNIVIVGGGPTGVELAGAIAEMKKDIFPKDYPETDFSAMSISVLEAGPRLLATMSANASQKAAYYLNKMGVQVRCNTVVKDYDGATITLGTGEQIGSRFLIWTAGVKANVLEGINKDVLSKRGRARVNRFNQMEGYTNIFAIGDVAEMVEEKYPNGHPQVAQPAMQQAALLAENLEKIDAGKPAKPFTYFDKGSMATIGRNKAVVDLSFIKFSGILAWFAWMFLHLMYILGVKNRLMIFINWAWKYVTYDQSLRVIMFDKKKE